MRETAIYARDGVIAKYDSCLLSLSSAYLLIIRSVVYDIGHQDRQKLSHSVDPSSKSSVWSSRAGWLACPARCFYPLSRYRVYNIEYAQLVCSWSLFEMGVDLLDEDGFILGRVSCSQGLDSKVMVHT